MHAPPRRRSWRVLALGAFASSFAPISALADMKLSDLSRVDVSAFPEPKWAARKERDRLTLACLECADFTAIDVKLSKGPPGTEERIRSGETTAGTMLGICKDNAARTGSECFSIKPANVKGAVGFVSDVSVGGGSFAATYTIYQDGDLLVVRHVPSSREEAARSGEQAFRALVPQIVR